MVSERGMECGSFFAALTLRSRRPVFPIGRLLRLKVLGLDFQLFFFVGRSAGRGHHRDGVLDVHV